MSITAVPPSYVSDPSWFESLEALMPGYRIEITEKGSVVATMSPSREHATIGRRLQLWLEQFVPPLLVQTTGHIATTGYGKREPDLMVLTDLPSDWATPAAYVRLVVEIVSPSNPENDWQLKMAAYQASGIPYYWIVQDGQLHAYRRGHSGPHNYDYYDVYSLDELLVGSTLPDGVVLRQPTDEPLDQR